MAKTKIKTHIVLAAYRTHKKTTLAQFRALMDEHARVLVKAKLRTTRPALLLRSMSDPRYYIEVFEWADPKAAERAHRDPNVMALWEKFGALCKDAGVKLAKLPEAKTPFPHFEPV